MPLLENTVCIMLFSNSTESILRWEFFSQLLNKEHEQLKLSLLSHCGVLNRLDLMSIFNKRTPRGDSVDQYYSILSIQSI